jgi:type IV pilus assembly protein PilC
VKQKELAIFTRQISVMIDAGLPLVQCLEILSSQQENKVFKKVLEQVRQDVEEGATFADALKSHPRVFSELYCNMVTAGETGGILDTVLQRLSAYIEKALKLKSAVRRAMIYPASVVSIAILVVVVILWKVIPTFAQLFSGLGAELPLPTRLTIMASYFIKRYIIWMAAVLALAIFGIRYYYQTYKGRRVIDKILLKAPVLGVILTKIAVARFCRTLGTLITSGVPILDGLQITAKTAGNAIIEDAVMETRKSIEQGKTIAEPLKKTKVFPPMVVQMISVGEQTGAMESMLSKIADFYEDEVDNAVDGMMSLLEPMMILFLGVVIGGIVVSMYMPMFSLINKI